MPRKGGRRKKKAAQKVRKPVESPDKEGSEGESSGSPESTEQIKQEPVDLDTQRLLDIAESGQRFDGSKAAASSSTPEGDLPGSSQGVNVVESSDADEENEKGVETPANSAPAREEIASIDDASDAASGEMSRAGPSSSRGSSSGRTPPSSPEIEVWNQLSDDENDESFTMEGQCAIRIEDEEERILRKVDIEPLVGKVGVIGCGPMAQAIIPYLIKTGHNVYAYNRHPEKFMELPFKPTIVSTPAALAEKCDVILCCVSGSSAVKNVMEGPDGVLKGMDRHVGKAYVEMSSVHPGTIAAYCQKVNSRGGSYLTAQIGRTRPAAYLGCSAITASGDRETFNKCVSCFAAFSSYAVYLSTIVTEAAIASISQTCIESMAIITLSDTMLATDAMGLPREPISDILEKDARQLAMLPVAAIIMIEDRPDVFIPVRHVLKNLRIAISLKRAELGGNELLWTGIHVCTQVLNQYPEAKDADISCLYKLRTPEYANPVPK